MTTDEKDEKYDLLFTKYLNNSFYLGIGKRISAQTNPIYANIILAKLSRKKVKDGTINSEKKKL